MDGVLGRHSRFATRQSPGLRPAYASMRCILRSRLQAGQNRSVSSFAGTDAWPSVQTLRDGVVSGRWKAEDLAKEALRRISAAQPSLNAFVTVCEDHALRQARAVDDAVSQGLDPGPLAGVPLGVKDNLCVAGVPMTAGSPHLQSYTPPHTAAAVASLCASGAVVVGKTTLDAWGMGSLGLHSASGPPRNPWDPSRSAGGSSGGSAAAVAAGLVPAALGSDTGGSIRQPAHSAGVVGLKPSYGAVSRWGLVAHASSLDCVGVLARSVEDAGAVFAHMQGGRAERDWGVDETCGPGGRRAGEERVEARGVGSNSLDPAPPPPRPPHLTVGIVTELWQAPGQDQGMRALLDSTLERLTEASRRTGAASVRLTTVSLPSARLALPAYYVLSSSEASANLARYDGILYPPSLQDAAVERSKEEKRSDNSGAAALVARRRRASLGAEALRRVLGGTYCLREGYAAATYHQAHEVRRRLGAETARALEGCDVLLAPVAPGPAPLLEEERAAEQDPLHEYAGDLMTVLVNLAGLPAVAVPVGLLEAAVLPLERALAPKTRLPAGLQVVGRRWDEEGVLRAARILEETCWGVTGVPLAPFPHPDEGRVRLPYCSQNQYG